MRIRISALAIAAAALIATAMPAFAQTGNGAPSGAHFNLNIIGVENPKTADMTDSNRKSIFVALGTKTSAVTSKIYLTPGTDFQVCDGNAFDPAYDCSGSQIQSQGAVFMLPCNLNLTLDGADAIAACDGEPTMYYEVWARALGQPGGSATVTTCATEVVDVNGSGTTTEICSTENVVLVRQKGTKPTFTNVTNELTSLVACSAGVCTRYALFRNELEDWFWQYQNKGLRLAQLRFYEISAPQ